jgi:O-antigen/teichoic acid export membrane protein
LAGIGQVNINRQGSVVCFVVILILDLVLIPKWGITGAAIASSVGYIVSTCYVVYKYVKFKAHAGTLAGHLVS